MRAQARAAEETVITTRVLLLTDVVDSTQTMQDLGDAQAARLWAEHDRAARDLLPAWRGREIDKTDGLLLLFETVADALAYARAYHAALAGLSLPLRARAGLHLGPVVLRENSADDVARGAKPLEVDGLAKPATARIMALAGGGQTLLSQDAHQALAAADAVGAAEAVSHGHWLMKGVDTPIELFEWPLAGDPVPAPAEGDKGWRVTSVDSGWRPVREVPGNLPAALSSFVGRAAELRQIRRLLEGPLRLLTLVGMGGLGKTRLSLQAAEASRHRYPDGTWFLDLSPLADPALIAAELLQLFGLRPVADRTPLQVLCEHLAPRRTLLVVDNCEHLIAMSAVLPQALQALLRAAPRLQIIATSREALRLPGEQVLGIAPLAPPPAGAGDDAAALAANPAVQLFVERARAHQPAFDLAQQPAAVAELVRRLEGIPLALELAAARTRQLAVADILKRLDDRYRLLTGGSRSLQQRQQTLRALVDWSYDLLGEAEQTLFARLSVLRGSFDLAAAEAVGGLAPLDPLDVMDALGALVDKSLVQLDGAAGEGAYRLLDTLRDYAADKLRAAPDAADVVAAHAAHSFTRAKQGRDGLRGPEQGLWLARMERELDNVRAVIERAQQAGSGVEPLIGVKVAIALHNFWVLRGRAAEGRAALQSMLDWPVVRDSGVVRAHVLYVLAGLAGELGEHAAALQALEDCLALRRAHGGAVEVAATLHEVAMARLALGHSSAARAANAESLALFEQAGEAVGVVQARLLQGQVALFDGDAEAARESLGAGLQRARQLGLPEGEAEGLLLLGQCAWQAGDLVEAGQQLAASLRRCDEAADLRGAVQARAWLGRLALHQGRMAEAAQALAAALREAHALGLASVWLQALDDTARLAWQAGDALAAVQLAWAAEPLRVQAGVALGQRDAAQWQALREALRADSGAAQAVALELVPPTRAAAQSLALAWLSRAAAAA